jgi:predicted nucleotidyltransferase component of viral defense system
MALPSLSNFNLVGGTALALQLGHRISIDLDLFTAYNFDNQLIEIELEKIGKTSNVSMQSNSLAIVLDEVKIDFFKYPYDFVKDFITVEEVRLLPIETIAVMKFIAISNRGAKKDFYDLYALLEIYKIEELVGFFQEKLPNFNAFHIIKSLTYFEDAELQSDPISLKKINWKTVKKVITQKVNNYTSNL